MTQKNIIWIIVFFTLSLLVYSQGFGNCDFGSYEFGNCEIITPPKKEEPSAPPSGGLNEDAKPALAEAIRKNQTPSCSEGNQYFEGACYPCPLNSVLFRRADRSVGCVTCEEGAEYDGSGGCRRIIAQQNKTGFNALELGSKLSPKNPYVGFALLLIPSIGLLYWLYTRFEYAKKYEDLKKKGKEAKPPMEEEANEKFKKNE